MQSILTACCHSKSHLFLKTLISHTQAQNGSLKAPSENFPKAIFHTAVK